MKTLLACALIVALPAAAASPPADLPPAAAVEQVLLAHPMVRAAQAELRAAQAERARLMRELVAIEERRRAGKPKARDAERRPALVADLERVLAELGDVGSLHKPRIEQAGFAVLKAPDIPSILVETAFISNPHEERRLRDPRYQASVADAIFRGIQSWLRSHPPEQRGRLT